MSDRVWPNLPDVGTTIADLPNPTPICTFPEAANEYGTTPCLSHCQNYHNGQVTDLVTLMLTEVWMLTTDVNRDFIVDAVTRIAVSSRNKWVVTNAPDNRRYDDGPDGNPEIRNVIGYIVGTYRNATKKQ